MSTQNDVELGLGASLARGFSKAADWRLLLLTPLALVPGALATYLPLAHFFSGRFEHSTRWSEVTPALDSSALVRMMKQLTPEVSASLGNGLVMSFVFGFLMAPFLAGAALFLAASETRPKLPALLSGAAGFYGKLLRMEVAALLPLGIAAGIGGGLSAWASGVAEKATSEAATKTSSRVALVVTLLAIFLAQLVLDAARARLAAASPRRSVFLALGAGIKLLIKRPLKVFSIGASTTLLGLGLTFAVMILRQQITQAGPATVFVALLLGQLAVMPITFARAAKLTVLVEASRAVDASAAHAAAARVAAAAAPPVGPVAHSPAPVLALAPVAPAQAAAEPTLESAGVEPPVGS